MIVCKINGEEEQRETDRGGWVQFGLGHTGGHSTWDENESSVWKPCPAAPWREQPSPLRFFGWF